MSEDGTQLIRRLTEEAYNRGNLSVVDEVCSSDFVCNVPGAPGPLIGPAGLKGLIAGFRTAFPDLHLQVEDSFGEGGRVAQRSVVTGTHQGMYAGRFPPTGKHAKFDTIFICRVAGDKLAEEWIHQDTLGMLQQLGAIPSRRPT
jgi:predicted ester cyclase